MMCSGSSQEQTVLFSGGLSATTMRFIHFLFKLAESPFQTGSQAKSKSPFFLFLLFSSEIPETNSKSSCSLSKETACGAYCYQSFQLVFLSVMRSKNETQLEINAASGDAC